MSDSIWESEQEILDAIAEQKKALSAAIVQSVDTGNGGHTMANPIQIRENIKFLKRELEDFRDGGGIHMVQGRPVR